MESSDISAPSKPRDAASSNAGAPRRFLALLYFLLPTVCACLLSGTSLQAASPVDGSGSARVESFQVASAEELLRVLDQGWQAVGLDGTAAPALAPSRFPPGLEELPVERKKSAFLRAVLPLVVSVNTDVARERTRVQELARAIATASHSLTEEEWALVASLSKRYRVPGAEGAMAEGRVAEVLEELLLRIDQVPVGLALSQAALESGWGTSRFAVEGNSLFGQWVFSRRGMDPAERPEGAGYSVARFRDLRASVAAYVRNLNTSWAYREYRNLRAAMRTRGDGGLDALALAGELLHYSARREAYVDEVRAVIRGNRLTRFRGTRLLPVDGLVAAIPREAERLAMDEGSSGVPPDA
ncbi:MAG: glucosaminidase domain-containing protein [Deferrisomatales bacterium]|nr:glucosaminidase domain-containing protein [Deferrisomatales bacterium]